MAKTKTKSSPSTMKQKKMQNKPVPKTPEQLYELALEALETSSAETALSYAQDLLAQIDPNLLASTSISSARPKQISLPALNLLGEIAVELGDVENARRYFQLAVKVDPEGRMPDEQGGGAEKFLWLAQLSEDGGADSVSWYEKGVAVLRRQIDELGGAVGKEDEEKELLVQERRERAATAICSVVEVYMTDLSWEEDAEIRCENLITEALLFAPESPEVLQTLASVRLSQIKLEDAQSALKRSMALWTHLDPEDDVVPDYPTRVSLARLLMEAELEEDAMVVLERLALEDDQSVEACYLGGWCLHLLAQKRKQSEASAASKAAGGEDTIDTFKASRRWLLNTLKLYEAQEYEDDRLKDHTNEIIAELNVVLGPVAEDGQADEEAEEWLDGEDSEHEEMEGA